MAGEEGERGDAELEVQSVDGGEGVDGGEAWTAARADAADRARDERCRGEGETWTERAVHG